MTNRRRQTHCCLAGVVILAFAAPFAVQTAVLRGFLFSEYEAPPVAVEAKREPGSLRTERKPDVVETVAPERKPDPVEVESKPDPVEIETKPEHVEQDTEVMHDGLSNVANCGGPDRASELLGECFCHAGFAGEKCSEVRSLPPCGPYDDRCFFHPDYGVAIVSEARWKGAQAHENKTWAEQRTSDRNDEHAANFAGYSTLFLEDPSHSASLADAQIFGDMIEFGAGPFTQSLTIFETIARRPHSITLLEPMAETYMKTVHACRYKNGTLDNMNTTVLPYAAEQLVPGQMFDTMLLLNFIEHVRDAFHIYRIAFQALRPGGLMVFHERFWPGYDGTESKNRREFDLNPIRLNQRFAHWMSTEFDLLYEKEQDERWGNLGYYWIGRKRAVPMAHYMETLRDRMDAHAKRLSENGWDENSVWGNIYNGRDLEQSREYIAYARGANVKTICEIGFAGGHSTVAYMTANENATIYSFDDFGKEKLTQLAYDLLKKEKDNLFLQRGDSTNELPKFSAAHPDVVCDVISVDGAHHAHFPDVDLNNFKFLANYPNVVLIDDYHKTDWPAVYTGVSNRVMEGSMKVRHVTASSIIFRNKQKQWAIGEYTLLTVVCATMQLDRLPGLKSIIDIATKHPVVQQVIVIWNGPDIPEEVSNLARHPNASARVTVVHRPVNSLNNRYDPTLPVRTGAVMLVDDAIVITKATIDCAFGAWKRDPSRLYSFGEGRSVSKTGYGYKPGGLPIGEPGTNFLLPRMVFHRKFLSVYFHEENKALRDYVDTHEAHCDDIAFASVVTKYARKPMVHVPAQNTDNAAIGLGTQQNRLVLRNECAEAIVSMLDWTMPTAESTQC